MSRIFTPRLGVFALVCIALAFVVWGCEYEPPVDPIPVEVVNLTEPGRNFITSNGYNVAIQTSDGVWRGSRAITPDTYLKTAPGIFFLRFMKNNENSPLFGYAWPDIPTCWEPPGYNVSDGAWRVTYCVEEPADYPVCDRQEMQWDGWNVTGLDERYKTFWFKVEHWDPNSNAYVDESPWFELHIVPQDVVEDPNFERYPDPEGPWGGNPEPPDGEV